MPPTNARDSSSTFTRVVRDIIVEHGWLLIIVGAYVVVGDALLAHYRRPWSIHLLNVPLLLAWAIGGGLWAAFEIRRQRRGVGMVVLWRHAGGALLVVLLAVPFHDTFQSLKQSIGPLLGFPWDAWLSTVDIRLHGGQQAWRWLSVIYRTPALLKILDVAYLAWFIVLLAFVIWLAWTSARRLRQQALLAFVLLWAIGGTVAAAAFASAGPVYQPEYRELAAHVSGTVASVAETNLMNASRNDEWLTLGGVSAFPSMHVGVAVLVALATWRRRRAVGVLAWLYAITIQIGSVVLGWHYAIDGYAGAVMTLFSWSVAGPMSNGAPRDLQGTECEASAPVRLP